MPGAGASSAPGCCRARGGGRGQEEYSRDLSHQYSSNYTLIHACSTERTGARTHGDQEDIPKIKSGISSYHENENEHVNMDIEIRMNTNKV